MCIRDRLDIATGTGIIANMLAETGYETVIGTDLSERMMNIAIKHAAEKGLCNVKSVSYTHLFTIIWRYSLTATTNL